MTTAHRPTFDPAKGQSTQTSGTIVHDRLLPAHSKLKYRQKGQGGIGGFDSLLEEERLSDREVLKMRLLEGEKEGRAGEKGDIRQDGGDDESDGESDDDDSQESGDESGDESDDDDDDDDDDDALQQELNRIQQERQQRHARETNTQEQKKLSESNPLLKPGSGSQWIDDGVFQNQARGVPVRPEDEKKGFVNDAIRSDFHRKFMNRYVR